MNYQKLLLLLVALVCFSTVFGQEAVATFNPQTDKNKDVFAIVNEEAQETVLFFLDKKIIKGIRFDQNFAIKDSLSMGFDKKEVGEILGYSQNQNVISIYREGSNKNEMVCQNFDFGAKKTNAVKIDVNKDKEQGITSITVNNIYYQVTASKGTSILNFYRFANGKVEKKTVDCSHLQLRDRTNKLVNFWDLYKEKSVFVYHSEIKPILPEIPASLVFSTNKKKVYPVANSLFFTFDENHHATQTLSFDLTDFSVTQRTFNQPIFPSAQGETYESNSFFVNDKLIQIKVNSGLMKISVSELDGKEIKTLTQWAGHPIEFKNSDIIQEQPNSKSTRVLETSEQLVRKIHNLNPSLSAFYDNEKYRLVIGGVSAPRPDSGAAIMGGVLGGALGAIIATSLSSGYSYQNLMAYSDKKVVYIHSAFDKNFNHIKGELPKLAFDKVRTFIEENQHLSAVTIFKLNTSLYLGGLDKKAEKYTFYKFEE
ncbi:hypothetical protein GV828_07320 [Flavobacterium sp. NST-5]|uniref:Uncharacterized protein n=1 Tax=Flavobacterium ichthyis TaxID=2698827 RepID=A0ABW9ZCF6_9FLAO|nr:hypothetical protein [Flavobacterium ichthyis]NBL65007.1 hypothetical protein [Flavobacterium ichthyis]